MRTRYAQGPPGGPPDPGPMSADFRAAALRAALAPSDHRQPCKHRAGRAMATQNGSTGNDSMTGTSGTGTSGGVGITANGSNGTVFAFLRGRAFAGTGADTVCGGAGYGALWGVTGLFLPMARPVLGGRATGRWRIFARRGEGAYRPAFPRRADRLKLSLI